MPCLGGGAEDREERNAAGEELLFQTSRFWQFSENKIHCGID